MAQRAEMSRERVSIVGRNLVVTESMKAHILLKLHKIEEITPEVISVHVYLEIQREEHRAEILYKFSHFTVLAHATKNDMYQAFDAACDKLKRKLRKWKTQIQSHHGKKLSEIEMDIQVLDRQREALNEINDQIEETTLQHVEAELAPPRVVKRKKRVVPTLTMSEAAMRMDLCDDHFLVYRSEEAQKIRVMYVRRDGTLGVLEVE